MERLYQIGENLLLSIKNDEYKIYFHGSYMYSDTFDLQYTVFNIDKLFSILKNDFNVTKDEQEEILFRIKLFQEGDL